ncbi:hypothetical protein MCOR06_007334 [Pyricularia oryzae]|uniref:Uncharacterized protein n=1 Tax=Pyricularia grisea TaxID=148305 RepID=A0ABQ8NDM9_PYRGI|nr:hypothetical protein MCOR01_004790 [Pyricularia oryzae]KAI6295368.1 hypothetical protein MCOR33_007711 [Pyricularia grisea]KAI6585125.1 hypothetical protein MCOR06_007334 [Pyricularia oryzae]
MPPRLPRSHQETRAGFTQNRSTIFFVLNHWNLLFDVIRHGILSSTASKRGSSEVVAASPGCNFEASPQLLKSPSTPPVKTYGMTGSVRPARCERVRDRAVDAVLVALGGGGDRGRDRGALAVSIMVGDGTML